MRESFKTSAPGKLLLLGEHAVLHGRRSLVCAVNQRISISVNPRQDSKILIRSELGELQTDLNHLEIKPAFRFVLAAMEKFKDHLTHGFELNIESEFDSTVGLGSSAAVTAAMSLACYHMTGRTFQPQELFEDALDIVRSVQGTGSGADLAASIFGGMLLYRQTPLLIQPLSATFPITVLYSGKKTPTTKVIQLVEQKRRAFPELFDSIYDVMDVSSGQAAEAIQQKDGQRFGELLNLNQGLMEAIGVSDINLAHLVYALRNDAGILGAKISGSGLGDCVVGLGELQAEIPFKKIPLQMSSEGLRFD